jgi:transmembrane sensor
MIDRDPLNREAFAWVTCLTSGAATEADLAALNRWRATSRAHRRAFAEANLIWDRLGPAAEQLLAGRRRADDAPRRAPWPGRRAVLGGGLAGAAAALAAIVARPPLHLWPSLAELAADYRTGTGERRHVALGDGVSIELNTQTSLAVRTTSDEGDRVELIAGEAAVVAAAKPFRPLVVIAGAGAAIANRAKFNVRHDGAAVRVVCLEGVVRVAVGGAACMLEAQQQVAYDARGLDRPSSVEPSAVTAWQHGLLVFRSEPLARVIDEVNRYRPGRIIVVNEALARRRVVASFRLDRLDDVVVRIHDVFGARVTTLPGGVVLLT